MATMAQSTTSPTEPPTTLTSEQRIAAYRTGVRVRAAITQCLVEMRKGTVRFWIGGPGEEVHGAATALAMDTFDRENGAEHWHSALFPHYRSDALVTALAELRGHPDFTLDYWRQALSRVTDPMTRGRQMVMHVSDPDRGIMPAQSPLGMNLGKAAGYARGAQALGKAGVAVAVCGDGTTGTSDFHECMMAAGLWSLPLLIVVTDNELAISVTPDEGRGIKDYRAYADAFRVHHMDCDGFDLDSTYASTLSAMRWVRDNGRSCLLHVRVPRLRGHSSSDGAVFKYDERDPLMELGQSLVAAGDLSADAVVKRNRDVLGRDWFEDHELGSVGEEEATRMRAALEVARAEPAPEPGDEYLFAHPPLPDVTEPRTPDGTAVQINEALNLALYRMCDASPTMVWGQDIAGTKGGVFKVTRGLCDRHPQRIFNAPINEPLIVGTAVGAAHHKGLRVFPEIQFGDYTLNTLHWLVHAGNIYWGSGGRVPLNLTLRTPVDPVAGGALYHSMSIDGFYTPVPGWVITCPSTAFDAYGLLRTAGEYEGPVLCLEPKSLYRRAVGPCLPGEGDGAALRKTRRSSGESLLCPTDLESIEDYQIPFGKAALRRAGDAVTLVSWGNAVHQSMEAAEALAKDGVELEVLDLRTLVPWDTDAVLASVQKTGRLLVAHQDRTFGSFGREIQGWVHEALPDVTSRVVGMLNVPAVAQAKALEENSILSPSRIADAARELIRSPRGAFAADGEAWVRRAPGRRSR